MSLSLGPNHSMQRVYAAGEGSGEGSQPGGAVDRMKKKAHGAIVTLAVLGAALCLLALPAQAGPHEFGVLVPHVNLQIEYTYGADYDGQSGVRDCSQLTTSGPTSPERPLVWYVLASFASSPGPVRLAGLEFGFGDYDASRVGFVDYGIAGKFGYGGEIEVPFSGWPGPNSGVVMAWGQDHVHTEELVEIYWFSSYVYGDVQIPLGPDAYSGSGGFATDGLPPVVDEVYDYGTLGFGVEGYNPCGTPITRGACCVADICQLVTRDECDMLGGRYMGDNTECFPNPCREDAIETSWGKLKRLYR
jgi:hypothetical protein